MGVLRTAGSDAVKHAMEAAGQALFEYEREGDSLSWADPSAARNLFGIGEDACLDSVAALIGHMEPEDIITREAAIEEAFISCNGYVVEYRLRNAEGALCWFEERASWLRVGGQNRLIGMVRTIDEQKQRETRLSYLARYDELTGQLNRTCLREMLETHIGAVRSGAQAGAYILVGIDGVGMINSDFGFDRADEVIVETSVRLRSVLTPEDVIGRVAGTKFGIILARNDSKTIRTMCTKILGVIRGDVMATNSGRIAVSVCAGAAKIDKDVTSAHIAMARAEAALDAARQINPSSWASFSEKTETVTRRKRNTEMSDVILTALNERQVCLAYQPIVSDLDTVITKYECLIRMQQGGREVPAPEFIPAAERLGLVHLLDRRVLELAIQTLKVQPDIALNVNISWETAKDPVWAEGYLAHLRANRDVASRITVELTETQIVDELEASIEFVSEIKSLGCHFAIDDFGAGYTSFRNLKALDIDVLKIDGSFVTGVSSSRENQLFVRTLLDLARNFQVKTVAEWVDNDADAMLLKGLGVDYLQGFYIGKPEQRPEWHQSEKTAKRVVTN